MNASNAIATNGTTTAAVFRKGSTVADISCSVEVGALLTVSEPDKARVRFVKYQEHWATRQPVQKAA
jgi:hypothetical protein